MGEIDQDGYFVFSKKRGYKDAWLDSIAEQDEGQVIEEMQKRVREEREDSEDEEEEE